MSKVSKIAISAALVSTILCYGVLTYATEQPTKKETSKPVKQQKVEVKEDDSSEETVISLDDFIGDSVFALQIAQDEDITAEKKRQAEEEAKRKAAEEKARQEQAAKQAALANASSGSTTYTGRYRLSLTNDSDETMIERINTCFAGYPVAGLGEHIVNVGKQNNLDPYFIAAVIWEESGRGTSSLARNNHNLFGRKAAYGWKVSDSFEADITDFGSYIVNNYFNYGLYSIETIGRKYCEGNLWASKIINHIRRLEA